MDADALNWITALTLEVIANADPLPPHAVSLLLRQYAVTGRGDLSDALGPALARAIAEADRAGRSDDQPALSGEQLADWLFVFMEAIGLSEDERLSATAGDLVARIQDDWPSRGPLMPALRSLDACLTAARLDRTTVNLPAAIDELERIVGVVYVPGEGISRSLAGSREPGGLIEHVAAASALLSAFRVAGRLPYPMLAEELMQFARREWWDERRGGFGGSAGVESSAARERFVANCEAARALCRLAVLHQDADYRQVAVIAHQSDYSGDAERTLESLSAEYRAFGLDAAVYGLALSELRALG